MKKLFFILIMGALILTGCSFQEAADYGSVCVRFPGGYSARTLSDETLQKTTRVIAGFLDGDTLYNIEDMKDVRNFRREDLHFSGIHLGNYTFIAVLLNDKDQILAMGKEIINIKAGLNKLQVNMGPGFKVEVDIPEGQGVSMDEALSLNLDDLADDVDFSFNGTTMKVSLPPVFSELKQKKGKFILRVEAFDNIKINVLKPDGEEFSPYDIDLDVSQGEGGGSEIETSTITFKNLQNPVVRDFLLVLEDPKDPENKAEYHIVLKY